MNRASRPDKTLTMMAEPATAAETRTLADELATHSPLPLADVLRLGSEIARCLARLHAAGQWHLDVCPAKVHWSQAGDQPQVQLGPRQQRGADNQLLGSIDPGYSSPELLQNGAVDGRSDLFSLGCVLYAMSTGHGPFWGTTPADLARSVRETDPRPACQLNPRLTAWLGAVIMQLLEKDPERRFADAAQICDMLSLQASLAGTRRRPPPRLVSERHAPVRVPIGEVVAGPVLEPSADEPSVSSNGRHEPVPAPVELARDEVLVLAPPAAGYWRRAVLAGIFATPVLIAAALLAGWSPWDGGGDAAAALPSEMTPPRPGESLHAGPIAFTQTAAAGSRKGDVFEEVSESLDPVIGFDVTTVEENGHLIVNSIRAIYRSGESARWGQAFGTPRGKFVRIEARPGYAVAGLLVRASSRVDGLRVRFMLQAGRALDPKDKYESEWVGRTGSHSEKLLGGDGRSVIGIHGRMSSKGLDSIGLMQAVE
ncbi:MAG TPA: hypothetical protein VHY20_13320, partial [Pirellulales bacterium]|nr:hypothetical protein [Pirellulales bacterium]